VSIFIGGGVEPTLGPIDVAITDHQNKHLPQSLKYKLWLWVWLR